MNTSLSFLLSVVLAFLSMVSIIQIGSAAADKHGLNTFYLIVGIIAGLASAFFMYVTYRNSRR